MGDYSREIQEYAMAGLQNQIDQMNHTQRKERIKVLCQQMREDINQPHVSDRELLNKLSEIVRCCFDFEKCSELQHIDEEIYQLLLKFRSLAEPVRANFIKYLSSLNIIPRGGKKYPWYNIEANNFMDALTAILLFSDITKLHEVYIGDNNCLHLAVIKNNIMLMQGCIKQRININQVNKHGLAPIHLAVINNSLDCLKELLVQKVNCQSTDPSGNTALHIALIVGQPECLKYLIYYFDDVNNKNNDGDTPLHLAIKYRHFGMAVLLIRAGADPELKNNSGTTAREIFKQTKFVPDEYQNLL